MVELPKKLNPMRDGRQEHIVDFYFSLMIRFRWGQDIRKANEHASGWEREVPTR